MVALLQFNDSNRVLGKGAHLHHVPLRGSAPTFHAHLRRDPRRIF